MSTKPGIDPSLLDLFRAELEIHLPALSEGLLELEKDPAQSHRLEALMRAAHSVKGAAKIVGIDGAVQIAHAMEDCFVAAQAGRITLTSASVDILLRGVDALPRVVPAADGSIAGGAFPADALQRLIADIAGIRSRQAEPLAAMAAAAAPPAKPRSAIPTLRPNGNLDDAGAETLRVQLADLLRGGAPRLRLDLAAVKDVAPSGLAVLAMAAATAARRQPPAALELANATSSVRTLLRMTRLDRGFTIAAEGR